MIAMIENNLVSLQQIVVGLATLITIRLIFAYFERCKLYQTFKLTSIPGPEPRFLDGNLSDIVKDKSYLHVIPGWRKKYGKIFGYFYGYVPSVVISDASLLRKFVINKQECFINRATPQIGVEPLISSILFAREKRWKLMRKSLASAFSSFRFKGEEGTKFIDDSVHQLTNYLTEKHKSTSSKGQPMLVDIQSLMKATALHLISSMALNFEGVKIEENEKNAAMLDEYLGHCDDSILYWAGTFSFLRSIFSFIATYATFGRYQEDILKQLRVKMSILKNCDTTRSHNVFEKMVQLHKDGSLTNKDVLGNCLAFLIAGYDTTSTTLACFFWCLSKYPDIQDKLRAEIILHGCESNYLKMVLNETLRLYPPVLQFTQREASEDVTVNGLTIKKGVVVIVNPWIIHREPDYWPEPEKFDPERFADMSKIDACTFVPFGIGQRFCLGYQLAQLEMQLIATELLMQYKFELVKPNNLIIASYGQVLSNPAETIVLELKRLDNKSNNRLN